jgi:hypothetical protein
VCYACRDMKDKYSNEEEFDMRGAILDTERKQCCQLAIFDDKLADHNFYRSIPDADFKLRYVG